MRRRHYTFESDWRPYAFPEESAGFSTEEELREAYTPARLEAGVPLPAGGMPVLSDGTDMVLNTENEMTIVFGATASKKTRTLILPLMAILAQAGESMVILDIKGELSNGVSFPQIRGLLEAQGYDCRFLNFRDKDGDGYNLLLEPYRLYTAGQRDEAVKLVNDIAEALSAFYHGTKADPFWEMTAKQYLVATIVLMFRLCRQPEQINMLSLASYTDTKSCQLLEQVADLLDENKDDNIMTMLRSVLSEPDKTKMSTLATVNSMLTSFVTDEKLLRMLSNHSTFDIHDLYKRPIALFLIVPDEVETYTRIVGLLLQQISAALVSDAYALGGALPRRVNFLCDEFCNYYVPGMARNISAHRSRNIRWYIVCQSMKQLQACYPAEADTILANCSNLYFLNSPELPLLEYLSRRAGNTEVTPGGKPRPILRVEDLQGLKKGWTHTEVYFTSGNRHFVSAMPDISQYRFLEGYTSFTPTPTNSFPAVPVYTASEMLEDARALRGRPGGGVPSGNLDELFGDD